MTVTPAGRGPSPRNLDHRETAVAVIADEAKIRHLVVVLGLLCLPGLAAASALAFTCPPNSDPALETEAWAVTVGTRTASCCAFHVLPDLSVFALDSVTLWCPRLPRPSVWVGAWTDPETGLPSTRRAGVVIPGKACRVGPHLRHLRLSPKGYIHGFGRGTRPRQAQCCPITVAAVRGPVAARDSAMGAFLPAQGRVTGFTSLGFTRCRQGTGIIVQAVKDHECPLPDLSPVFSGTSDAGITTFSFSGFFNPALPACGGQSFSGELPWTDDIVQGTMPVTGACTGALDVVRTPGNAVRVQGRLNCACCGGLPIGVSP